MLIDTHAHLNFPDFEQDLDQVINRALKKGVKKIICVSSNVADAKKAIKICQKYPGIIYAAVGIHPQQTDPQNSQTPQEQIRILETLARAKEVVAIGECGLDYSSAPQGEKDRSKEEQFFLFKKQIEIAQKLNLPLIVHSRKAFDNTIAILKNHFNQLNQLQGVFHCYSAGVKEIKTVGEIGFYFGLDGNLTYDVGLQNVAKQIPIEKIILETDSPFLTPLPLRGLRNEPANVKIIAEFLAKLKGISFEEVCQKTSENVQKLFPKTR